VDPFWAIFQWQLLSREGVSTATPLDLLADVSAIPILFTTAAQLKRKTWHFPYPRGAADGRHPGVKQEKGRRQAVDGIRVHLAFVALFGYEVEIPIWSGRVVRK
jgi:hypothetical protein